MGRHGAHVARAQMHPRRRRHLGAFHERPGGHLLNDRLSVSRRIIVRSGARKRCTAVLVIALPTLRASRRARNRRADIDATSHCRFDRRPVGHDCIKVFISRSRYNTLLLSNDKCVPLLTRLGPPSREARPHFGRLY